MAIIWINLLVVYVASFFSRFLATPDSLTTGPVPIKPNAFLVFIVMVVFVLVAGLRNNIGDTFFYMYSYTLNDFTWAYILAIKKDIGFGILQMMLKKISHDPQLLIFVTALVTNVLIVRVLYKYSRLFELSVYIYVTSGMYIVSMNGVRQFLAAALIFAATKYLLEGKWKIYFLVVILASTFHQSALILIPIYYIVRRKAWTMVTFLLLSVATLLALGYNQMSDAIFSVIENTQYGEYKEHNEGGANFIRVGVQAAPLILAFVARQRLRELFPNIDYIVNLSLLSLVFMIIATQNWIFARFLIYFGLYNIVLIPWVVKSFVKQQQKSIYYAIVVFYLIYFFYENVISLGLTYKSDYF